MPEEDGRGGGGRPERKAAGAGRGRRPGVPYTQLMTSSSLDTLCRWKPLGLSSGMCRVCVEPVGRRKEVVTTWSASPPTTDVMLVTHRTARDTVVATMRDVDLALREGKLLESKGDRKVTEQMRKSPDLCS